MKKIKEAGSVSIGGGNFNSSGPPTYRKTNKHFSGHNGGGSRRSADDIFGGVMGLGKTFPVDYFDEDGEDDEEENLNEGIFDGLSSALFSVPIIGDLAAAARFLWNYFGPYGLRAQLKKFTKTLEEVTNVELGNDFLEPEDITFDADEFDERFIRAVDKLKNIDNYPDLKEKLTPSKIIEILDRYDELLDSFQNCFISFFGAADYFAGQAGLYTNLIVSTMEPIDFVNWIAGKYLPTYIQGMKKVFPDEKSILTKMKKFIGKPLDYFGHYDLIINEKKLQRIVTVNEALNALRDIREGKLKSMGEEETKISKTVNFILDKLFESYEMKIEKNSHSIVTLMEAYLSENLEEEKELLEEPFDEIDLEKDIDEQIAMAAGGIQGVQVPIGQKSKKMSDAEYLQKEQIDWMRRMEMYHKKTTNRLK